MTRVSEQRHTAERTGLLCDLHPQILDEGLDQQFNSLQAQREACEAVVNTQRHAGWVCLPACYDDGGFSDATMDRPRSATAARRYRREAGRRRRLQDRPAD